MEQTVMATMLEALIPEEGFFPTALHGLSLLRRNQSTPSTALQYDAGLLLLLQGTQHCQLNAKILEIDSEHCLLLTTPMQFECTTILEHGQTLFGVFIHLDQAVLAELLLQIPAESLPAASDTPRGMQRCPLTAPIANALQRLLDCLTQRGHLAVLGPAILREILFHLLLGEGGPSLLSLFSRHSKLRQIQRSIEHIQRHYALPLTVSLLAELAGMSNSAFHSKFKTITGLAPIQYLKNTRLHQAHRLLMQDNHSISQVAYRVGYASASQFSREFKRLFGTTPRNAGNHPHQAVPLEWKHEQVAS